MSDIIIVDWRLLIEYTAWDNQENTATGESGHLIFIDPEDKPLSGY